MRPQIGTHISRRLAYVIPVWLGISLLAFSIAGLAPGDPAAMILQQRTGEQPTLEAIQELREELGLDDSFPARYSRWLVDAIRGDLGTSYRSGASVFREIAARFPSTIQLAIGALMLGVAISLPLGVVAAVRYGSAIDHMSRLLSLLGTAIPSFVLGYLLILFFSVTLGVLPVAGSAGWRNLVLPVLTLGLGEAATLVRLTRANMLEVLGEDYVRTARAKGLPHLLVLTRHALRNALNPLVTLTGVRAGRLLGGAVIVETIFAREGVGKLLVDSIQARDYPMIQGFVLFSGTVFLLTNLLVDLGYLALDPRVRLGALPETANAQR